MRDAINPPIGEREQRTFVGANSQVVSVIGAVTSPFLQFENEWVMFSPYWPAGPQPIGVRITDDSNPSQNFQVTEPIFISAPRRLAIVGSGYYLVTRAPRREMLSQVGSFDGGKEGATATQVFTYSGSPGLLDAVGGKWLVIDSTGNWQSPNANTLPGGTLFGRAAADPIVRGRYYEIEYAFTASAGTPQMSIAHLIGNTVVSTVIGLAGSPNAGVVRIGDNTQGISGAASFSRSLDLGSSNSTLALTSGANGIITFDTLKVIRQGY